MNVFFIVLARDKRFVAEKIQELTQLGFSYIVICGEPLHLNNVIYRPPIGKYDAINFGFSFIPKDTDIVVLNDVDTSIHNSNLAISAFDNSTVDLVFGRASVDHDRPQYSFLRMLNSIRQRLMVAATGDILFIRFSMMKCIVPIRPCKAEDSYILFKISEMKGKIVFCKDCYSVTEKTQTIESEGPYKRRTVCGLYQALRFTKPFFLIRFFFYLLPFISPLLLLFGKKGYYWMNGILLGLLDYLQGDIGGTWTPTVN